MYLAAGEGGKQVHSEVRYTGIVIGQSIINLYFVIQILNMTNLLLILLIIKKKLASTIAFVLHAG